MTSLTIGGAFQVISFRLMWPWPWLNHVARFVPLAEMEPVHVYYAPVHNYARASNNKRLFLDPHSFGTANAFWRWRRGLSKGARRHGAANS